MKRRCGLYRSDRPLPLADRTIEAPALLFLHDHSPESRVVVLPMTNVDNRWHFGASQHDVDEDFVASLVGLRPEGLYRLREHIHLPDARVAPASSLVQLGYNARAEPLIFFPKPIEGQNAIAFPQRGTLIPAPVYDLLEGLDLRGPRQQTPLH